MSASNNGRKGILDMVTLGNVTLANGLAVAPLTRGRATMPGNMPNAAMEQYYVQRAKGGYGLIISEGTQLSPKAIGWYRAPGLWCDEQQAEWTKIVSACKAAGPSKMCLQLWHLGRQGHATLSYGESPVSASNVNMGGDIHVGPTAEVKLPHEAPRALLLEEIPEVVAMYVNGAKRAMAAGFDFVEIHGANGYLIDQFMQTHTNIRTDAYGGSVDNRLRFMREVLDAVVAAVGKDKVGIRFSPNGSYGAMGHEGSEETFSEAIKYVASKNIAYIHCMDGTSFGFHELAPPFTMKKVRALFDAAGNKSTVLMGNCGHTKESADALVASGEADMVAFGRPTLNTPDLPKRFQSGEPLNAEMPYSLWWFGDDKGYTDVPLTAQEMEN